MSAPVRIRRTYNLPAPADRLWPVVSDTNRLNQLFGLPQMRFKVQPDARKGRPRIVGMTTTFGAESTWEEHPFEWVDGQRFSVLRTYERGPLYDMKVAIAVSPTAPQQCDVEIALALTPRNAATGLLLKAGTPALSSRWKRVLGGMARYASGGAAELDSAIAYEADPVVVASAAPAREALVAQGFATDVVGRLVSFIASRPDHELSRIRPYEVAARLGTTREDALRLFLFATRAGLVSLSWDILCPHCRGSEQRAESLKGVTPLGGCQTCGIQYDVELDRNVEVTFTPLPGLRKVEAARYCFGGPAATPHVRVQQELLPGETRTLDVVLAAARYRVRAAGVPGAGVLEVAGDEAEDRRSDVEITVDPVSVAVNPKEPVSGRSRLRLVNHAPENVLVVVETSKWMDEAATAAAVAALQDFRDLFGREVLASGQNIQIGQATLMFTDLKGSTAMYEEIGDVKAFALVHDHFRLLANAIRDCRGAIVKTIGDAVMAVFDRPADAVRCALEVQRRATGLKGHDGRDVVIKIGVHSGSCLAVELNERLDYFGNMVNVAARAQNESTGWDVVLTEAILRDAAVQEAVRSVESEPFDTNLKGIAGLTRLTRLWPVGRK